MSDDGLLPNDVAEAKAPFHTGGDVILRSSDGVDFHFFKFILSQVSPFFQDMFNLPQPTSTLMSAHAKLPIISVTESRAVLDDILRTCYPCTSPIFDSVRRVNQVLEAAAKYGIEIVTTHARDELARLTTEDPIFAYIVACRFGFTAIARAAIESSISLPVSEVLNPSSECMELATMTDFLRLLRCRVEMRETALECLTNSSWIFRAGRIQGGRLFWAGNHSGGRPCWASDTKEIFSGRNVPSWWRDQMQVMVKRNQECFDAYTVYMEFMAAFLSSRPSACPECTRCASEHIKKFAEALCQEVKSRQSKAVLKAMAEE